MNIFLQILLSESKAELLSAYCPLSLYIERSRCSWQNISLTILNVAFICIMSPSPQYIDVLAFLHMICEVSRIIYYI